MTRHGHDVDQRRRLAVAALVAASGAGFGCGAGDDDANDDAGSRDVTSAAPDGRVPTVDVTTVDEAMAAVDRRAGGPQRYFEVTANAQLVRLFVADERAANVTTFVYVDGEVTSSGEPASAAGFTFTATDVDFDEEAILDAVVEELPDAVVEEFSVVGADGGSPRYAAFARSTGGGRIDVVLSPGGEVLEVGPVD